MARSTNLQVPTIHPEVLGAMVMRAFQEKIDIFNAASGGTIQLSYDTAWLQANGGDFTQPIHFATPSGVIQHVDEADPATALTPVSLVQAAGKNPIAGRVAYIKWTRDELMRGGMSSAQYTWAIAQAIADARAHELREGLLGAAVGACGDMDSPSANCHTLDASTGKVAGASTDFTYTYLNRLLQKLGDARAKIKVLALRSELFHDLVGDSIANYKIDTVAGMSLTQGTAATMGKDIIIADSAALTAALTSSYYTEYKVLGLAEGALKAKIVSEDLPHIAEVDSSNVKYWTVRQDYDVEYEVQGMKWTTTINPTNAELATTGNWTENYSDHREAGIVLGIFNSSVD